MSDKTTKAESLNHQEWLKTVAGRMLKFVDGAVARWNAQADEQNQWSELGWDERDAILTTEAKADV